MNLPWLALGMEQLLEHIFDCDLREPDPWVTPKLCYRVLTLFKSSNAFLRRSTNVTSPLRNHTRGS